MKEILPVKPVCVSSSNNFWTDLWILIKFVRLAMPLKVASIPLFLIP
jgi:hypothetical protein